MTAFDVKIRDTLYSLMRDAAHVHRPELHAHLGTTSEAASAACSMQLRPTTGSTARETTSVGT